MELCTTTFPMYICRLTLAWILAKILQRYKECQPNLTGLPHCRWTLSHADWSLRSGVRCRLLLSVVPRQLPTSQSLCHTLWWRPLTTSGHVEIAGPKPFVWFRAKTDKGIVCLADYLHSVTILYRIYLPSTKSEKMASSCRRKEAKGTSQKQSPTPTTLMT